MNFLPKIKDVFIRNTDSSATIILIFSIEFFINILKFNKVKKTNGVSFDSLLGDFIYCF